MAQQKGSNVKILMGFESTFGTAATEGYSLYVNAPVSLSPNRPPQQPATLRGNRNPVTPFYGNLDIGGDINIPIDSTMMSYWLKAMFGAPTTTGTDPYTHEYKIGDDMPSFTFEEGFEDLATSEYIRYVGCKASRFSMSVGGDGELVATMGVLGANYSIETSAFDATPTEPSFTRLYNSQATVYEGGSAAGDLTSFDLAVEFGLDPNIYPINSQGARGSLPEGAVSITGNIKALFKDVTLLTKAKNKTETSLKVTIQASSSSIFEVEIPELQLQERMPSIDGPQGLLVDLDFFAYYDDGADASAVIFSVTNSLSSV